MAKMVGAELKLEALRGSGERWQHDPRVVDQAIDAGALLEDLMCGGSNGIEVCKVEMDHIGRAR